LLCLCGDANAGTVVPGKDVEVGSWEESAGFKDFQNSYDPAFYPASSKMGETFNYCQSLRTLKTTRYSFARPLVLCFTNAIIKSKDPEHLTYGIIPQITIQFLKYAHDGVDVPTKKDKIHIPGFKALVKTFLTFAVVLYGLRVLMGKVDELKMETFVLLFKVAGMVYFLDQAPMFYKWALVIMQQLNDGISDAAVSLNGAGFCNGANAGSDRLWDRWDCIFLIVMIGSGGVGIGAMLLLLLVTAGTGILIVFAAIYFIVGLLFAVARFIHIYLMAVLSLSFIFCLGYLFVPLIVFKGTAQKLFIKWLNLLIAYMLIPVITLGFMGMMLVALDVATFSGTYSIWRELTNSTVAPQDGFVNNAFALGVNPSFQSPTFKSMGHSSFNNTINDTSCAKTGTGVATPGNAGVLGNTKNQPVTADCFEKSKHPTQANIGFNMNALDVNAIAAMTGTGKAAWQWLRDVALAFSVAALLTYVMLGILQIIPEMAADLVTQGERNGSSMGSKSAITKSAVFGETLTNNTVETVKTLVVEAAAAYVTGGTSLARAGGKIAIDAARQGASKMAARRR
jgi:hypothetical protein